MLMISAYSTMSLALLYAGWGFTLVRPNQAKVVERNGKVDRVIFAGAHFLQAPGLIDKVTRSKNAKHDYVPILQQFPIQVFEGMGPDGKLVQKPADFADGVTAPVDVKVFVQIGHPGNPRQPNTAWTLRDNLDDIEKAVLRYVYASEDAKARVASLIDDIVRPILQRHSSDQALQQASDEVDAHVKESVELRQALFEIGLWLVNENPVTIGDVDLPTEVQQARQKNLLAKKDAEALVALAEGTRASAHIIAKGRRPDDATKQDAEGDESMTVPEALAYQQRQAALKALEGSHVTVYGQDLPRILESFLGRNKSGRGNPPQRRNP